MKKIIGSIILLFVCSIGAKAQITLLRINDGLFDVALKQRMEFTISNLLTEFGQATANNRPLQLQHIQMTDHSKASLERLWNSFHFDCDKSENEERCLTDVNGYEIRNISVTLHPIGKGYKGELEKELTISLSRDGMITGVHMALANNVYQNIVNNGIDVTDTRRRLEILNFVEAFRSYYDEKDIAALKQVYSDDALIITGKVIMRRSYQNDQPSLKPEIVYSKKNKEQYLKSLESNFRRNRFIKVSFDSISVVRHPAKPNFYGVTLHQNWKSTNYEDDGYVFLLWEFKDDTDEHPVVHVRTWQPDRIGTNTLAQKDIFNINDFFIP